MAYTDSSLASYTKISPHKTSPRDHKIDTITIHCMAGHNSGEGCAKFFALPATKASSNYCIGDSGDIAISVHEKDRSWCSSSGKNDNRAITIEVSSDAKEPYKVKDTAYDALIRLCTDICRRNGISKLIWSTSKNVRVNHLNGCNMTVHRDYHATKTCPGTYLYNRMDDIASKVNANLAAGVNYGPGKAPTDEELGITGTDSDGTPDTYVTTISVDASKIYPYVALIKRNSKDVDFSKIASGKFTGVIIELGDASDSAVINPKLKDQTSGATAKNIPYGLYLKSTVSSKDAVKDEIKKFSIYIYKFSPKLGIWIDFKFTSDKKVNDAILDAYKERLELMGFKKKIGIYATKSDLSKISWKEKSEDWYLHLVDHVSSTSALSGVLNSSFFSSGVT